MRAMPACGVSYARSGYETIVDFSIPPAFAERAKKRLTESEQYYIVLLPEVETCEKRAGERAEGRILDYAPYREFYDDFNQARATAIVNDCEDPGTIAVRIREGIRDGLFRVSLE